jgi:hypothetical protein
MHLSTSRALQSPSQRHIHQPSASIYLLGTGRRSTDQSHAESDPPHPQHQLVPPDSRVGVDELLALAEWKFRTGVAGISCTVLARPRLPEGVVTLASPVPLAVLAVVSALFCLPGAGVFRSPVSFCCGSPSPEATVNEKDQLERPPVPSSSTREMLAVSTALDHHQHTLATPSAISILWLSRPSQHPQIAGRAGEAKSGGTRRQVLRVPRPLAAWQKQHCAVWPSTIGCGEAVMEECLGTARPPNWLLMSHSAFRLSSIPLARLPFEQTEEWMTQH